MVLPDRDRRAPRSSSPGAGEREPSRSLVDPVAVDDLATPAAVL
jgi:hypothetical protein